MFSFRLHAKCMVIQGQKLPGFEKIDCVLKAFISGLCIMGHFQRGFLSGLCCSRCRFTILGCKQSL